MKNDTSIYFDLIRDIKIVSQLDNFSSEIDLLLENIFASSDKTLDDILKNISISMGEKLKEILLKKNIKINDKESIKNLLLEVKTLLKQFKVIKLTIAIDPSYKTIEKISSWVSSNLGQGFVLDIDTDNSILGGSILVFNGQYQNLTLEKTFEDVFATKRKEILNFK